MNLIILVICRSCEYYNSNNLGMPGFIAKETGFEFFSEAHKHMLENPEHCMDFQIVDNTEQADE